MSSTFDRVGGGHFIPGTGRSAALTTTVGFMDRATQPVSGDVPTHPATVPLTGVYHNLLRRRAEL